MSVDDYKDYAATVGVILLDSICAIVMFYVLHLLFSVPNLWIGIVIIGSIITRTGLYDRYINRD